MKQNTINFDARAEIVESSLQQWIAQSWQWNYYPPFGSLCIANTKKRTYFGIVCAMQTRSIDNNRYPHAYQKTEEELLIEQPQIFELLTTTFTCITIGYQENSHIYYIIPPELPPIHTFVGPCPDQLAIQFFSKNHFLHVLFGGQHNSLCNIDELLLALCMYQKTLNCLNKENINHFIKAFSLLTGNDYRRLKLFLERAQELI